MLTAILLAAQLTIPPEMMPPRGEYRCYEAKPTPICILRYDDVTASIITRKVLETELEASREQQTFLAKKLSVEFVRQVECASLTVTEPSKAPKK